MSEILIVKDKGSTPQFIMNIIAVTYKPSKCDTLHCAHISSMTKTTTSNSVYITYIEATDMSELCDRMTSVRRVDVPFARLLYV